MAGYVDVYQDIQSRLDSPFNVSRFMVDTARWDKLMSELPKLKVAGKAAVSLDGRLDIISNNIYGTPLLDWVLLVYNKIRKIGGDILRVQRTLNVSMAAGSLRVFAVKIRPYNVSEPSIFTYLNSLGQAVTATVMQGPLRMYVTLGSVIEAITFSNRGDGGTDFRNMTSSIQEFQITYMDTVEDDTLVAGHVMYYPSLQDIRQLLLETEAGDAKDSSGFARL